MYLLTRPVPGIEKSQQYWHRHDVRVTCLGLVDIVYEVNEIGRLETAMRSHPPTIMIVTSQYAVKAMAPLAADLPATSTVLAVGAATATALARINVPAQSPAVPTSEGLLEMPALKDAKNQQIAIIKGEGGRTTLQQTLTDHGALVDSFAVYRRVQMKAPPQTNQWQWDDVKGIIATSEAMVRQLFDLYDSAVLTALPWLTVSPRVADVISTYKIINIGVANGASDEQLCRWIKENWE